MTAIQNITAEYCKSITATLTQAKALSRQRLSIRTQGNDRRIQREAESTKKNPKLITQYITSC
jgi:hypothetical protein